MSADTFAENSALQNTATYAEITGWGKCVPPAELTNDDLATFVDTSDEWITTRTGIKARRISHVNTAELAALAAKRAMAAAGISPEEVDLVALATSCPDTIVPNTASKVQQLIGAKNAAAFDLNSACTGFLYALQNATAQVRSGMIKKAVVIGAERMSWWVNWALRETAVLFGDGAGAVVIEASDKPAGLVHAKLGCDSEARDILEIRGFGTDMDRYENPPSALDVHFMGPDIFKRAVRAMGQGSETVLKQAQLNVEDIDLLVPHQANLRIIASLQKQFKLTDDQVMVNIHNYGNTSAATVPIALCEAVESGRVKPGANIMTAAFGAGLTWGAGYIKWGERVTPVSTCDEELPANDKSAKELLSIAIKHCLNQ
ncbi:ketoacyl-ACP synthase III [Thalassotalea euphylliae]|uniref:Beta-ketoacyl-[acyl-carrier-protein] synthase III n=1 Tax=Thalassotalea euphylliae TaxID=1655234 RepID=A0A3E0U688_9GAMM|nr:ketoacyl-ACP synthase III [Thalassotalea euphylliae]REL31462.1 ketoacyl-ACP synthase III [Thalassotalea euphylliae]